MNLPFFVGSLPFQSVSEAIDFVKKHSSHLPFLPQLPELNPQEDMIGQVLRGFELGHWDEKASTAMELFQNEFVESRRFKIQVAGPATVSRTLSLSVEEVLPQWMRLVQGLGQQFRQAGFLGEMWIQVDEPFWSEDRALPEKMIEAVAAIQKKAAKTHFGIHSCASRRPQLSPHTLTTFRFFSFDYTKTPLSDSEKAHWESWLQEDASRVLVWGGLAEPESVAEEAGWLSGQKQVWTSTACGLYGKDPEKLRNLKT